MKILTDHNISPKVARALNALVEDHQGSRVIALRDKFAVNIADVDWITELGNEGGWSVISGDLHIQKNKAERVAWMQTNLIGYFLEPSMAALAPIEQTSRLLLRLKSIEAQSRMVRGPAMFSIPIRGGLRQIRSV